MGKCSVCQMQRKASQIVDFQLSQLATAESFLLFWKSDFQCVSQSCSDGNYDFSSSLVFECEKIIQT